MCEVKKAVQDYVKATRSGTRAEEVKLLKRLEELTCSDRKGCPCAKSGCA